MAMLRSSRSTKTRQILTDGATASFAALARALPPPREGGAFRQPADILHGRGGRGSSAEGEGGVVIEQSTVEPIDGLTRPRRRSSSPGTALVACPENSRDFVLGRKCAIPAATHRLAFRSVEIRGVPTRYPGHAWAKIFPVVMKIGLVHLK
jgi:hypothetical protein